MTKLRRVASIDLQPIKIFGFHLKATGVEIVGRPKFDEFGSAVDFARQVHHGSGFWLADLLAYAETRPDWSGLVDAVVDSDTLTEASVKQYRYVANHVAPDRRVAGVSFAHHAEVASLPAGDQTEWLEKARDEGLTQRELRAQIRKSKRTRIIDGQSKEVATILTKLGEDAWAARDACAAIASQDGKHAEDHIKDARRYLEACEEHVTALRKLTGRAK